MENVSVTVNILERPYKLSVAHEAEPYLRQAASLIDSQARLFRKQYGDRDKQDLLAMVALRKKLLSYLARENYAKYIELTDELAIRRTK